MNTELLRQIADAIEAEPAKFDMSFYVSAGVHTPTPENFCRTTMCIGGWAWHLSGMSLLDLYEEKDGRGVETMASLLGISDDDAWQLFNSHSGFWHGLIQAKEGTSLRSEQGWDWMTENPTWVAEKLRELAAGLISIR